jgi:nucleoside-diphosphate-sugar epimerase
MTRAAVGFVNPPILPSDAETALASDGVRCSSADAPGLLLTGATGLIGGELAPVLAQRGWRVWALVRSRDPAHAAGRLRSRLERSRRHGDAARFVAVPGDIRRPHFGLAPGDLDAIRARCEVIVHCAAETAFVDNGNVELTNVVGTRNLVELARTFPRLRGLYYVSSAVVCTAPPRSEIVEVFPGSGLSNAYIRSKREAEALLLDDGLPATILRPSIVVSAGLPDRRFARAILWVVPVILRLGSLPIVGEERLDIVPVGYVAEAIAQLVAVRPRYRCYHISAGAAASVTCRAVRDALRAGGRVPAGFRFAGREGQWDHGAPGTGWARLRSAVELYLPFIRADVVYANDRLREELGGRCPVCPPFNRYCLDLVERIGWAEAVRESARP